MIATEQGRENDDEGMEDGHRHKRLMIRMRLSHVLQHDITDEVFNSLIPNDVDLTVPGMHL